MKVAKKIKHRNDQIKIKTQKACDKYVIHNQKYVRPESVMSKFVIVFYFNGMEYYL